MKLGTQKPTRHGRWNGQPTVSMHSASKEIGPREAAYILTCVFSRSFPRLPSWALAWRPACRRISFRHPLNRPPAGCGLCRSRRVVAGCLRLRAFESRASLGVFSFEVEFVGSFAARKDLVELTAIGLYVRPLQIAFIGLRAPPLAKTIAEGLRPRSIHLRGGPVTGDLAGARGH